MSQVVPQELDKMPPPDEMAAAFEQMKEEIELVDEDERIYGADAQAMAITAFGAAHRARTIQPDLDKVGMTSARVDRVVTVAKAAFESQKRVTYATQPNDDMPQRSETLGRYRRRFSAVAVMLETFELMDGEFLEKLRGPVGYRNVGSDVQTLGGALSNLSDEVLAQTPLTRAILATALNMSAKFLDDLGKRELSEKQASAAAQMRNKAVVLLEREYEELRHGVVWARRKQGDADSFAPSLHATRTGKRRKADGTEEFEPALPPAAAPAPAPAAPAPSFGKNPMDDDPLKKP